MSEYYLAHHGILGQRWGVRRYQNEDGTLTVLGREHYGKSSNVHSFNYDDKYGNHYKGRGDINVKKSMYNKPYKVNDLYSEQQSMRDSSVYSTGASRRIAKRVFSGESVQGARASESDRLESYKRTAKTGGKVLGSLVGIGVGAAAANLASKYDPFTGAFAGMTAAAVTSAAAKELTEKGIMIAGGYDPIKRYK